MRHGRTARLKPYTVPGTSGKAAKSDVNHRHTPPHEVVESLPIPAQPAKGVRQTTLFQGVGFIERPRHLGLWRPSTSKTHTRSPEASSPAQLPAPSQRTNREKSSTAAHVRRSELPSASPAPSKWLESSSGVVTEGTSVVSGGPSSGERQLGQDDTTTVVMCPETPAKPGRVGLSSVGAVEGRVVPDTQNRSKAVTMRPGESSHSCSGNSSVFTAPSPIEGTRRDVTEKGRGICRLGSVVGGCSVGSGESSYRGSEAGPESPGLLSYFKVGAKRRVPEKPWRAVSVGGWSAAGTDPGQLLYHSSLSCQ